MTWCPSSDSKYPASQLVYQVLRNGNVVGTTTAGVTQYIDNSLAPGTYFSYTILAKDPSGNASDQSAALAVKTKTPSCAKPSAPQGFSGAASSPTTINLSWKAVSNPSSSCVITGYVVSRDNIPLSQPTGTSFSDTAATPNTKYEYNVLAVETGNIAGPSSSVSVTTPQSTQPDPGPSAPNNVAATAVSDAQVNVTWSASADSVAGIKQYDVYRNNTQVGTSTTPSFGDTGLSAHTQYTYVIVAVSGTGKTASSTTVSVTTLNAPSTGGGTGGTSSGSSSSPSASLPPVLQGTTSVGTGSDTGLNTSQNPTVLGANTATSLDTPTTSTKTQTVKARKVAYISGSAIGIVAVIVGAYWWMLRRRQTTFHFSSLNDPDFASKVVVGDNKHGPQGGQPS